MTYPYKLPPLPYAYDALEPYIDTETMHYHHGKHFQTYINNLNKALEPHPGLQKLTLEELLSRPHLIPREIYDTVMNNAGGVYNHNVFFNGLAPASQNHMPDDRVMDAINESFGTFDSFRQEFTKMALAVFGSGWTCLAADHRGKLVIKNLKNQETVLIHKLKPVLLLDVWEHAYYLQYKNARADYIAAAWNVLTYSDMGMLRL